MGKEKSCGDPLEMFYVIDWVMSALYMYILKLKTTGGPNLENSVGDGSERFIIGEFWYLEDVNTPDLDIVQVLTKLIFKGCHHTVLWHLQGIY